MNEAIHFSLSRLSDADLEAMAVYLRKIPPQARGPVVTARVPQPSGGAETPAPVAQEHLDGRRIFEGACAGCHLENGQGRQSAVASLQGRRSVHDAAGLNVVQVILHGSQLQLPGEHAMMPAFADAYSDAEIASAAQFVVARFGGVEGRVSPEDVNKARGD